jgi:phosphatidate cytidylyltransferase
MSFWLSGHPFFQTELFKRIASAVVLAPLAVAAVYIGGLAFTAFWFVVAILVSFEFLRMLNKWGQLLWGTWFIHLSVLLSFYNLVFVDPSHILLNCIGPALFLLWLYYDRSFGTPAPWSFLAMLYSATSFLAPVYVMMHKDGGAVAIIFAFAVVWGTDVGAYFVGRYFGGPKLAPRISPGKTWSGFFGGLVLGTGLAFGWCLYAKNMFQLAWVGGLPLLVLAAVGSVLGQIGDLFESFIKRRLDVKNSGTLIPGHGGVMDRIDSILFVFIYLALLLSSGFLAGPFQ